MQIRNHIALTLELAGVKGNTGRRGRPQRRSVIYIVFIKAGGHDLFRSQILRQLINNRADDLQVAQFFRTYIVLRNVPNQALYGNGCRCLL